MSDARVARGRLWKGYAWIGGGVALYIFVSTLLVRLLDIPALSSAVIVALAMVYLVPLRGLARFRLFLRSRDQARQGFTWLGFCLGVAIAFPLATWLLTKFFTRLGL